MIHTGDCVEVMATMEPASVDAIVTDPPYGLEFMGKEWDRLGDDAVSASWDTRGRRENMPKRDAASPNGRHSVTYKQINPRCRNCGRAVQGRDTAKGFRVCSCDAPDWYQPTTFALRQQEWHERWAREALRIAKPGAYLLAFGGTRTYHRMTCAIEDAGWIIRDCLVWAYASGFPKSRALLKPAWEPIVMARKPGPLRELAIDACRIGTTKDVPASPRGPQDRIFGAYGAQDGTESGHDPNLGRWPANLILTDPIFDGDTPGVVMPTDVRGTGGIWHDGDGVPAGPQYGDSGTYSRFFLVPKSDRSEREPITRGGAQSGTRFNTHPT